MKQYAVLNSSNIVENIIVASTLEMAEKVTNSYCIQIPIGTIVHIGYVYSDGNFSVLEEE
jgi:hypothetical protein